jgi:hypothetical protein
MYAVHARKRKGRWVFRLWSATSEEYHGEATTAEHLGYVLRSKDQSYYTDARLKDIFQRARATGESERGGKRRSDLATLPWKKERCQHCDCFHHKFSPSRGGRTACCANPRGHRSHGQKCPERGTLSATDMLLQDKRRVLALATDLVRRLGGHVEIPPDELLADEGTDLRVRLDRSQKKALFVLEVCETTGGRA